MIGRCSKRGRERGRERESVLNNLAIQLHSSHISEQSLKPPWLVSEKFNMKLLGFILD